MNSKNRLLQTGIACIAVLVCAAAYLYWNSDSKISSGQAHEEDRTTGMGERTSLQSQTNRSATVQHLIDSGQFDPPPGNTERLNSAVSPFNRSAQAEAQRPSPKVDSSTQGQPSQLWVAGAMPRSGVDKMAFDGVRQDKPAPSNQILPPIPIQAPAQIPGQSQPVEFESPPGVGSPKGGR